MLFPVAIDVPMARWPWMNWALMSLLVLVFLWSTANPDEAARFVMGIEDMAPELGIDEHPLSWLGHMFLHADIGHLLGNLLFMWVFGNAACAKIGQIGYVALWLGAGLLTAVIEPYGLGASGAINGVVGFCLIFYPINDITMFYFFIRPGTFALSSYWMILMWLAFDLLGMASGDQSVAYLSHVSGLAGGAAAAIALLKLGILEPTEYEQTALDLMAKRAAKKAGKPSPDGQRGRFSGMQTQMRLHVRLANGVEKHLPLGEFLRHEQQGKQVNHFQVSEDGQRWTTFGQWRQQNI